MTFEFGTANVGIGINDPINSPPRAKLDVRGGIIADGKLTIAQEDTARVKIGSLLPLTPFGSEKVRAYTDSDDYGIYVDNATIVASGLSIYGIYGSASGDTSIGSYGVYGISSSGTSTNHGVQGVAQTASSFTNYGVYGFAENSGSGKAYGGYFIGDGYFSGNVGIGTASAARKLHINDVMRLEPRSSAPSSPIEGDIYYDSTLHSLMVYNGITWKACF